MKATAHLLYGFAGAGKTTLARTLERELPAVRFSPDEWMNRLYGQPPSREAFDDCYDRIMGLIWQVAARVLELGRDVVLDCGFWSRASRDDARSRLEAAGARTTLYHVTCPEAIMRRRVLERSQDLPHDSLWIDAHAFELFKARFEPLGEDEEHVVIETGA